MKILSEGVEFRCKCGIHGIAETSADFKCVRCNDEIIYSIVCPNCTEQIEIDGKNIPEPIRKHIKVVNRFWYHD